MSNGPRPRASYMAIHIFITVLIMYIVVLIAHVRTTKTLHSLCVATQATCDDISREQLTP